ncbi:MAG: glycosyltransferase [Granulosicoccus sp.]
MEELTTPLVSVLLPVRTWRSTTAEAVNSLLNQSLRQTEILLIGHDDINLIVKRLPSDPRIKGIAREGRGIVAALNTGLKEARAPFIARMDDDDIAYPDRLEKQLAYLKTHPDVQLCATRVRFIDEHGGTAGVKAGNKRYEQWLNNLQTNSDIVNACFTECPMPHPTLMAHKDVWKTLGGYRDFDGPEDYDLVLRAMLAGVGMGKPTPILQNWREHTERLTYRDSRYRREAFTHCRAWAARQPGSGLGLNADRSVWICGTGKSARQWHHSLKELGVPINGFVDIGNTDVARTKQDKPVISYEQLTVQRGASLVVTALSEPKAREALRQYFDSNGWTQGKEYIFGA